MSTLATNAITDASGGNTASINGQTPTESNMAGRNRIINGDMRIDQRNAGASYTSDGNGYSLDRWMAQSKVGSKYTVQQSSDVPAGFTTSLKVTSSSAYSVGANDYFNVNQRVEGFNIADFGWGTANAQTITVSFWVKSSLTGTFGGSIRGASFSRSYPFTYSISAANTWEQKTVTIAGDTYGTWLTTNGIGLQLAFGLGTGATYTGTAGAWASSSAISATGAVSVVGTSGATFYLTGVQLEAGSVATPFERRQYGQELQLAQRYYEKGKGDARGATNGSSQVGNQINFRVTKRASATIAITTIYGNPLAFAPSENSFLFYGTTGENTGTWTASAEL